ncbi:NACHT domain-containing protein [Streptomyces scopuliridis]|uniref:NACHT domain-containing protein n=1 Tax=Streptomyces scopuliridis TaxID=452529 RepID=UPI003437D929
MSDKANLSAGRQALREALRELEQTTLQGRTRTEAIDAANRWLEQAGLAKLRPTTVGGWFEEGSPAKDFRSLWALVRVLVEWSGQPSADTLSGPSRGQATARWMATEELWKTYWEHAKDTRRRATAPANAPLVAEYLTAARDAARQHPYPGVLGAPDLPTLADVYVHQQAHNPTADDQDSPSPDNATMSGNQASPAVPATEVFREDEAMCVLLGGPGGGKSTLLCAHLADSADAWLDGRTGKTLPVMVSAAALTGTDLLPTALAKAVTGDLRQVGLLNELTADFFRQPPRAGVSWLVLVDGLDEIPDTDTRSAVLTMLAGAASARTGLYRFVVATRPLPESELRTLGRHVPRYELQPFSNGDLLTYATHWFQALDDPGLHARAFMAGLKRSHLQVLARTPLMAFMLCQLYAADPARPLPDGRAGTYQSFVELIYEQNAHKNIKTTHDEAIRRLKDRHQIPKDNQAAEQAAGQARDHLTELIDHLAYERINGSAAPAVEILASHLQTNRPQKVKQHLWNAFLGDLLRPTGILTQRADDFGFLHQTLLEYHAARHATRDEQARTQSLHDLIPNQRTAVFPELKLLDLHPSYIGFVLDGLLRPGDQIATITAQRLEHLALHGGERALAFFEAQVELETSFPQQTIAVLPSRQVRGARIIRGGTIGEAQRRAKLGDKRAAVALSRLAASPLRHDFTRIRATQALAQVDGYQTEAAELLTRLATDLTLWEADRGEAAEALAQVDGYQTEAAELLAVGIANPTWSDMTRASAARALAELGDERAARPLAAYAADPALLNDFSRVNSARWLARMDGHQAEGAALLTALATDADISAPNRVKAAEALAETEEHMQESIELLTALATDPILHVHDRWSAAKALVKLSNECEAKRLLAHLAPEANLWIRSWSYVSGPDGALREVQPKYYRKA